MKYKIISLLLVFYSLANAQHSKFSVEASYPLTTGQNFIGQDYNGVLDLGVKYKITTMPLVNLGASVNASLLKYRIEGGYSPALDAYVGFKTSLYLIQPRVYAEINLKRITKLHPSIGLGYSFFLFKTNFDSGYFSDESNNEWGINLNLGLSYDLLSRMYIQAGYDFIKLTQLKDGTPSTSYHTNAGIIKLGLGIRI
ncbi:outer membrane beta-barrel protein [Flavobacterium sp. BFFFF1]|uniref:outer membrane beta-barrel protein n=1 Tax=Flavobacterium sp. BFFFF1 TaxID=2015557 RepID=UPI0025B88BED|nr:outer membrane beta-barrel protein [Flavobacterium sp. BFFFF1]